MGTTTYGNDAAGARTAKNDGTDSWSYVYDGESRLTRVTKNGSVIEDNGFDGAGMRVKKVNNGKTTYYLYAGPNPIMEYSASDSKYTYYIFAGTKSVAEETNGMKTFYHRDHLGSTRATTDQDRKITGLCKYDAWGKIESTNEYDAGVVNGDFELTNSLGVQGWTAVNDNPVLADCVYLQTGGLNGSAGLKITRNNSGDTAYWARRNLFVSPDTDYVLTGYFLSGNAQSTKAHAQLVYHDAQGNILKIDDTGTLGYSGSWKAFTLSSHSPANAATMEIWLTEDGDQGMAVFFDGLRLKVPGLVGKYDFTGKREDEGIGLTYFGERFYDPESCRFTTMDAMKAGWNWYRYSKDNPINVIDLTGNYSSMANYGNPDGTPNSNESTTTVTEIYNIYAMGKDGKPELAAIITKTITKTMVANPHAPNGVAEATFCTSITMSIADTDAGQAFADSLNSKDANGKDSVQLFMSLTVGVMVTPLAPVTISWVAGLLATSGMSIINHWENVLWNNAHKEPIFQKGGRVTISTNVSETIGPNGTITDNTTITLTIHGHPTETNPFGNITQTLCLYNHVDAYNPQGF